jgi:hypothetical protein
MDGPFRDLFIFVGLIVLLFIVWVATGGPERAESGIRTSDRGSNPSTISRDVRDVARDVDDIEKRIAELKIEGIASPYRDLISFSGGNPGNDLAIREYVRIRASSRLTSPVNITGWRVESLLTEHFGTIPSGTPLPFAGVVNSESPIFLAPGEMVIIVSSRSPLGVSFRENLCTGYLDQVSRFTPALSNRCPDPDDEFKKYSNYEPESPRDEKFDQCVRYVRRIDRCEVVRDDIRSHGESNISGIVFPLANECATFIENNLTYQGCVRNHLNKSNFYQREWRVFLGSFVELWRKDHEVLRLLDATGRVVDVWQY